MATLDADIDDKTLRRLLRKLFREYPKQMRQELRYVLEASARKIQDEARENVPVDTSNLQSSIQVDRSKIRDLYVRVGSGLEYARILEFGYTGTQQVDAHRRTITQAFGTDLDQPMTIDVSAHERQVDRKGTYYLTRAAAAQKAPHQRRLKDAAVRVGKETA